jgi:hypothetical protein
MHVVATRPIIMITALFGLVAPACAKPLVSVWTLEPQGPVGAIAATFSKPFLEQRLLPLRLARLREDASLSSGKILPKGTYLFVVFQNDGQAAYCTIKDQSSGHVAKSFFIPILDKRPCLVDTNRDGIFEAAFSVFDKYGSALTPSGNLSSSKPLKVPAGYDLGSPKEFPVARRFSYALTGGHEIAKVKISVQYDNGSGYVNMQNFSPKDVPGEPSALNLTAKIVEIKDDVAKIDVRIDPDQYLLGDSGGAFGAGKLPDFIGKPR